LKQVLESLWLQVDIVRALAFREQSERIRKSEFGAVGLLVEPLIFVGLWLLLRIALRARGSDLMNPVLQFGSGFVLFYLFSSIALRAINGVSRAQRFADLRRVRPLDVLMAGALVESQIYSTCLVLVIVGVALAQWHITLADPGAAVAFFLLLVITALGVGISALVIGHRVPLVKLVVKLVVRRLLFWTSGLFFSIAMIPEYLRPYLLWNPLLHGIELFRHALVPSYPIPGISLPYFLAWALGSVGFSMLVYGNNEQLLVSDEVGE
jgi:capsular polysaccharide transport system permease protein